MRGPLRGALGVGGLAVLVCTAWLWAMRPPDHPTYLLAFSSNRNGNSDLYLMTLQGEVLRQLTDHPTDDAAPHWSPQGDTIAFLSGRDGLLDVYALEFPTGKTRRLAALGVMSDSPRWSPDGTRLAFAGPSQVRPNQYDVFVLEVPPLGDPTPVLPADLRAQADQWGPTWAPNGESLAYLQRGPQGAFFLNQVALAGGEPERMAVFFDLVSQPRWSPDGRWILVSSRLGTDDNDLFRLNVTDKTYQRLTTTPAYELSGAWSPDGASIAYVHFADNQGDIYLMNADGSEQRPVLEHPAHDTYPTWSPPLDAPWHPLRLVLLGVGLLAGCWAIGRHRSAGGQKSLG